MTRIRTTGGLLYFRNSPGSTRSALQIIKKYTRSIRRVPPLELGVEGPRATHHTGDFRAGQAALLSHLHDPLTNRVAVSCGRLQVPASDTRCPAFLFVWALPKSNTKYARPIPKKKRSDLSVNR